MNSNNNRFLYEAFNDYYNKGVASLNQKNTTKAKRYFGLAAESLLKLAQESKGSLKEERFKRAEEILGFIEKIEKYEEEAVPAVEKKEIYYEVKKQPREEKNTRLPKKNLDDLIKELYSLEGLDGVKQQISDLMSQVKVFQLRKQKGIENPNVSYHMVFTGNPGTGKTTVARLIGQIYNCLGILSKGHLVETDRSGLVGAYVGHTEKSTLEKIEEAKGGILFIDEAYTLKRGDSENDFGQIAIDLINKAMEDCRGDLIIIAAGYPNEMKGFINSNPGLKSRFKTFINFDDYNPKELYRILEKFINDNNYVLDPEASKAFKDYLESNRVEFTGNARDVRNLFEAAINLQSRRVSRIKNPTEAELVTIKTEDLPKQLLDIVKIGKKEEPILGKNNENIVENAAEPQYFSESHEKNDNKITFNDIAGLDSVKEVIRRKFIYPIMYPEAYKGYNLKENGGLFLYGPPGTGKTMIAAAIANEIGAHFISVRPSDLLKAGVGNSEKAIKNLFLEARAYPKSVIYFDEVDSLAQKNTKSSISKQIRSELLTQMQGVDSYDKDQKHSIFLIGATNKPWDVDSAFVRPGRFGSKVYVGLPDENAREFLFNQYFEGLRMEKIVELKDDIDVKYLVSKTESFNCSDINNLLSLVNENSIIRCIKNGLKYICMNDFEDVLEKVNSSVQKEDLEKLKEWKVTHDII